MERERREIDILFVASVHDYWIIKYAIIIHTRDHGIVR